MVERQPEKVPFLEVFTDDGETQYVPVDAILNFNGTHKFSLEHPELAVIGEMEDNGYTAVKKELLPEKATFGRVIMREPDYSIEEIHLNGRDTNGS